MIRRLRQVLSAPYAVQALLSARHARLACSQEGEDVVIERLGVLPERGVYIDVGAFDPFRYSNTARLYRRRWRGVLVEPDARSVARLERHRRRDLVEQAAIGSEGDVLHLYLYDDGIFNTADEGLEQHRSSRGLRSTRELDVPMIPLATVQRRAVAHFGAPVDLISTDTEGLDLEVLQSGEWDGWCRPKVVVCEILGLSDIREVLDAPVVAFMEEQGYLFTSRLKESAVFVDRALAPDLVPPSRR